MNSLDVKVTFEVGRVRTYTNTLHTAHSTHIQYASIYTAQKWLRQTHPAEWRQTVALSSSWAKPIFDFCAVLCCTALCIAMHTIVRFLATDYCLHCTLNQYLYSTCITVLYMCFRLTLSGLWSPSQRQLHFCPQLILHCTYNGIRAHKCTRAEPIQSTGGWFMHLCHSNKYTIFRISKNGKRERTNCVMGVRPCVWVWVCASVLSFVRPHLSNVETEKVLPFGDHRVSILINYLWLRNVNFSSPNKLRQFRSYTYSKALDTFQLLCDELHMQSSNITRQLRAIQCVSNIQS